MARAALEVVLEKGHRALTTAEVASKAGMSETAMLYHFPSRDHILVAAMELADQQNLAAFLAEEDNRTQSADGALFAGERSDDWDAARLARLANQEQATACLYLALLAEAPNPEHPAHEYVKDRTERALLEFTASIKRRQSAGKAHPDIDPRGVARQMMAAWSGLRAQWLVDPSFDLAYEVAEAYRALTWYPVMEARKKIAKLMDTL